MKRDICLQIASGLLALALMTPPAAGAECGPDALGVSRVVNIGRARAASVGLQSYPRALALQDREVVLTFDDGPAGPTAKVLDALAKECAKATFFVIGRNADEAPESVRRAAREGHSIGHHSYSHPAKTLRLMDGAAARADIEKGIAAVTKAAGGSAAPFFRFPGFADTPELVAWLNGRGYTVFGSDLWASDWTPMTPKAQLDLVLSRLEKAGKGIILFHDSKSTTAQMLPDFLRELKSRGYRLAHMVPGDGDTQIVDAGPTWKSTTEPIIAKTLGGKGKAATPDHGTRGDAGVEDHTHDLQEPPAQ